MSAGAIPHKHARVQSLLGENRITEAKAVCADIIKDEPDGADGWYLLGAVHAHLKEMPQVIHCFQKVIGLQPRNGMAYYNLGVALQTLKRYKLAEGAYRQTIHLQPENTMAHENLATILLLLNRAPEAIEHASKAVRLSPALFTGHNTLGLALKSEKRYEEAIRHFLLALQINPRLAEAHYNLGVTYYANRQPEKAIPCFLRAIDIHPGYSEAHCDLGVAFIVVGDFPKALEQFNNVIGLYPDHVDAHWNRALTWLQTGNFENGWPEYEWRLHPEKTPVRILPGVRWDGSALGGRRIFIYAEQGLGDTIHFVRYLSLVKKQGAFIIFECQPELYSLMKSFKGIDQLMRRGEPWPAFDTYIPLLSLPGIFHTRLETIPCQIPYLQSSGKTGLVIPPDSARRVGIVWAGSGNHRVDNRSCPLDSFDTLVNTPGARFFSLQKGEPALALRDNEAPITDLGGFFNDFADTAAAIAELDMVITIDTSVAHLAGAMGKPVWILLPFAADWRWMLDREDSPWYPTMRLFRQPAPGDWASVIRRVCEEVQKLR